MQKFLQCLYAGLLIILLSTAHISFAEINLNVGEVQLSVAGILLDVEGSAGTLDEIAFNGSSFDVTIRNGQNITFSSADRRQFSYSPTNASSYVSRTCSSSKSTITIDGSALGTGGAVTITITPESSQCTVEGGGAGGGIGGGAPGNIGSFNFGPSPTIPTQPSLNEIIPPPLAPPTSPIPPVTEQPPVEQPVLVVEQPPTPTPFPSEVPPQIIQETIQNIQQVISQSTQNIQQIFSESTQAANDVGSGIISIAGSVGGGIIDIFHGATSGNTGSGYIVFGVPNSGSFIWDTAKSLAYDQGFPMLNLIDGSDYNITIISTNNANIQDTTDMPFSFISAKNASTSGHNSPLSIQVSALTAYAADTSTLHLTYPNGGETLTIGNTYTITWTSLNFGHDELINLKLTKGFVFTDNVKAVVKQISQVVSGLQKNPVVTSAVKKIVAPVTVATAATGATIAFNFANFLDFISLARFWLFGLIRMRRRKPWGRVFDKLTGTPIRGALIQIYDADFKKIKDTQLSDAEGRFTEMAGIGKYYLKISRNGFQTFETATIAILSPDQILNLEIALSPDISVFSIDTIRRINIRETIKRILDSINPLLLAVGTLLSAMSAILVPAPLNFSVLIVYGILDVLKIYFSSHLLKPFGTVTEEITNEPITLAVIRIFDAERNLLVATKVSDKNGRFNTLLAPGNYYLTCAKAGFTAFRSAPIKLEKSGLISLDVKLSKS